MRWETGWSFDGKLCTNIRTKNYQNLIIDFQATVENVRDVSLGDKVYYVSVLTEPGHSDIDLGLGNKVKGLR